MIRIKDTGSLDLERRSLPNKQAPSRKSSQRQRSVDEEIMIYWNDFKFENPAMTPMRFINEFSKDFKRHDLFDTIEKSNFMRSVYKINENIIIIVILIISILLFRMYIGNNMNEVTLYKLINNCSAGTQLKDLDPPVQDEQIIDNTNNTQSKVVSAKKRTKKIPVREENNEKIVKLSTRPQRQRKVPKRY